MRIVNMLLIAVGFVAVILICILSPSCRSNDQNTNHTESTHNFTAWPHFRGNAALDGVAWTTDPIRDSLKIVWTFKTKGACISSPVTDGTIVYIGSYDSTLYALDIKTGEPIWKFKAGGEIEASPTIFGNAIFIGDLGGNFFSINKATGGANWSFKLSGKIAGAANIIPEKNFVLFGCYDDTLYCLNAANGAVAWKYGSGSYINGTPAISDTLVVFGGCDAGVHVVNISDGAAVGKIDTESYIAGSAVFKDNFAYVGSYGGRLMGIDITSALVAWTYANDTRRAPFIASPALIDTFLIAPSRDRFVHCVSSATGRLIWKFAARGQVDASPVVVGNRVVVGCSTGVLYLIDLATGALVNSLDLGVGLGGAPLVSGGTLIVGDDDGLVTALR